MALALKRVVDAHHHLWDLSANRYPWLTDCVGPRMYGDYAAMVYSGHIGIVLFRTHG